MCVWSAPTFLALCISSMVLSGCSLPRMPWDDSDPAARSAGSMTTGIESPSTKIDGLPKASAASGELHYEVESERVAKDNGCGVDPIAHLLEKGPGYESYSVACGSSQIIVVRCDFSNCRAMR